MIRPIDKELSDYIKSCFTVYKDWPKQGINYLNTVELCRNVQAFRKSVQWFSGIGQLVNAEAVFAADARGFLWGGPVAYKLEIPLHTVRKKNKMPGNLISQTYELEYGTDALELARVEKPAGNVLVIDDVLATGGTAEAICKMLNQGLGIDYKNIYVACLLNITFLPGQKTLENMGVSVLNLVDVNE